MSKGAKISSVDCICPQLFHFLLSIDVHVQEARKTNWSSKMPKRPFISPEGEDIKNIEPCFLGVTAGHWWKSLFLVSETTYYKSRPPLPVLSALCPQMPPKSVFCEYLAIYEGKRKHCRGRKCFSWNFLQDKLLTSWPMPTY